MNGPTSLPTEVLRQLRTELAVQGYTGEIAADAATRAVYATDNSVYEMVPQLVLFPKQPDDLNRVMRAARSARVEFAPRGGGTGTNGQSLSDAVVVDCSRYLTRIEHIDPEKRIAVVQPGLILNELNRAAGAHGLHFGPTVSTASRATLGGMAATDASGKGSRVHGRTSDHILSMDVVLSDGSDWTAEPLDAQALDAVCARPDLPGHIHRELRDIARTEADEIARVFPVMNRGLTGYNLRDLTAGGHFTLTRLLSGSEGTLALTKRLTLRLVPKKPRRALLVLAYDDALAALGDAERLVKGEPAAIEFIDDKILSLAREDSVWSDIAAVLEEDDRPIRGLNFVEIQADTEAELHAGLLRLRELAGSPPDAVILEREVADAHTIAQLWALRAKCVGLLGRMDPARQGTPFVEDAAVPPQNLRAFVEGFRNILDENGLSYGMFGHADVGCVHVRPALDMRSPGDAAMIRKVSDAVASLAQLHGGILWGEHGKGYRGEYGPMVFGERLYAALCRVKRAFDPLNLLNPGKIASPSTEVPLKAIDAVPYRGEKDSVIPAELLAGYDLSVKCNGNGQCFNRAPDEAMCPSYKATADRRQSPKGRAALLREWLRMQARGEEVAAFEEELHASLATCLSCKACASRCPVKVDIPAMRSRFLENYFQTRKRPARDHLLASMEAAALLLRADPRLGNLALKGLAPLTTRLGLVDLPAVRPPRRIGTAQGSDCSVLLLTDSFLGTFDGTVIESAEIVLRQLGCHVTRSRPLANGKALSVLGMRCRFASVARARYRALNRLARKYDAVIEIEPAVHDMVRSDYAQLGLSCEKLIPLDRFLTEKTAGIKPAPPRTRDGTGWKLFPHCSEISADPQSASRWQRVFAAFGQQLTPLQTGCCGMAGVFGHVVQNQHMSRKLYEMTWQDLVEAAGPQALATGFSCRCQVKRLAGVRPRHPVEVLAKLNPEFFQLADCRI